MALCYLYIWNVWLFKLFLFLLKYKEKIYVSSEKHKNVIHNVIIILFFSNIVFLKQIKKNIKNLIPQFFL